MCHLGLLVIRLSVSSKHRIRCDYVINKLALNIKTRLILQHAKSVEPPNVILL